MARAQQVKGSPAERTLTPCELQANRSSAAHTCTIELRASQQRITGTVCTDCTRAHAASPAQPPQLHTARLSTTGVRCHTPSVFPEWQHTHPPQVAQSCISAAHSPSDVRICTPHCLVALYIQCSPPSASLQPLQWSPQAASASHASPLAQSQSLAAALTPPGRRHKRLRVRARVRDREQRAAPAVLQRHRHVPAFR